MTTALPSNMSYGQVVYRCMEAVADGGDVDRNPDGLPVRGVVITFTPNSTTWANATALPDPVTVVRRPVVCVTDSAGYLTDPMGQRGVYLVATNDPDLNPTDNQYVVTVEIPGLTVRTFNIEVPAGSIVDLTLAQPVSGSAGDAIVVGPPGPSNVLSVGTVTTGAPGSAAAAAITGTSPAQVLGLTIPRGATGGPGAPGDVGPPGTPTAFELRGAGFPEGVVTAPVGTYYTDTAATAGAIRWVKAAGTGNAGWAAAFADTGERNISGVIDATASIGSGSRLRRIGGMVHLYIDVTCTAAPASPLLVYTLPVGFRPNGILSGPNAYGGLRVIYNSFGPVNLYSMGVTTDRIHAVWTTKDAWPATLPGIAG